jgi:hypothetical protein
MSMREFFEMIENYKMVKLSESNRSIIESALLAYKNTTVYLNINDEAVEILELEIDEILEKIKE